MPKGSDYGLYFNAATGTWDTKGDWTAEGSYNSGVGEVPVSGSPVYLYSTVQDLTVSGTSDQATAITATGTSVSGNTLDITGSLTVGGLAAFTSFDVVVEHGAVFSGSQLSLASSLMQVAGR